MGTAGSYWNRHGSFSELKVDEYFHVNDFIKCIFFLRELLYYCFSNRRIYKVLHG
jgi:hypothetical protein